MQETLTDFEMAGFHSQFCLADGHAYQDLHPAFDKIINSLPKIWHDSAEKPIYEAENHFNKSYSTLIQSPILANYKNFKICPTASNSIDLIAAAVNLLNLKTILVEPTFDNLALLFRRRGVQLDSISDKALLQAAQVNEIDKCFPNLKEYGALFLVNPNNPTGLEFDENALNNIISFCKQHGMLLIIDNCFRIHKRTNFDDYNLLINSNVSFMTLEDTGKVWPTQDLKASLVYFSEDMKNIFNEIYNEVYLCVSNFSLGIISAFFEETAKVGIQETIWNVVDTRRALLRKAIQNSTLFVSDLSVNSNLPVEWLVCNASDKNDFTICHELKAMGLAVLPGRQFYWNSFNESKNQRNIRVSLLKRQNGFIAGLGVLQKYCQKSYGAVSKNEPISYFLEASKLINQR